MAEVDTTQVILTLGAGLFLIVATFNWKPLWTTVYRETTLDTGGVRDEA
ncbi:MAG: hypothetical protein ACW99U_15610 [Candidatus Thorarchaeota archaeon]|jgi:hypothetical protein